MTSHSNLPGLLSALKQCSKTGDLRNGRELHMHAVKAGCHTNKHVATALIRMYGKTGRVLEARLVFEAMVERDVVAWTSFILAYVENGECLVAMELFQSMDCSPDAFTFAAACKTCAGLVSERRLEKRFCSNKAMEIHRKLKEFGFDLDVFVASSVIDMYSKCGLMNHGYTVFQSMKHRDVVSWNIIILGYVENGMSHIALETFEGMDCRPNSSTALALCKACSGLSSESQMKAEFCLEKGMVVHSKCRELGFAKELAVMNALIDMYCKCGSIVHARAVFGTMLLRNVVSWTSLILGYVENKKSSVAIDLFINMDCEPDSVTYVAALKACARLFTDEDKIPREFCLELAIKIHKMAKDHEVDTDNLVASNLIDIYSKLGSMQHARAVFENMLQDKDVVPWNSLIHGYVENGESATALELFSKMDCQPNHVTIVAALKACACLGSLAVGQRIHAVAQNTGLDKNLMVATSLVDFYGKCGSMIAAEEVFRRTKDKDIALWNALIDGYISNGDIAEVLIVVRRLEEAGLQPNEITFLAVLTACNHLGLVEEGNSYLESMSVYGVEASVEHYTCVVDMLGRANRLREAMTLVESMPCKANNVVWTCLLGACKKWNNTELGKTAFAAIMDDT